MTNKKSEWEIERDKQNAIREKAIKSLTPEQTKVIDEAYNALAEFVSEYSEMFDVTSDNARKLQHAFWNIRHEFNKGD